MTTLQALVEPPSMIFMSQTVIDELKSVGLFETFQNETEEVLPENLSSYIIGSLEFGQLQKTRARIALVSHLSVTASGLHQVMKIVAIASALSGPDGRSRAWATAIGADTDKWLDGLSSADFLRVTDRKNRDIGPALLLHFGLGNELSVRLVMAVITGTGGEIAKLVARLKVDILQQHGGDQGAADGYLKAVLAHVLGKGGRPTKKVFVTDFHREEHSEPMDFVDILLERKRTATSRSRKT